MDIQGHRHVGFDLMQKETDSHGVQIKSGEAEFYALAIKHWIERLTYTLALVEEYGPLLMGEVAKSGRAILVSRPTNGCTARGINGRDGQEVFPRTVKVLCPEIAPGRWR
jgi:hypothetical protein